MVLLGLKISKNKPKTFEPYKIIDGNYLNRVKNDLVSYYAINLSLNKKITFGQFQDSKVNLVEFKKVDEIDFSGEGKLKAGENSKILHFHLKAERISGEYTNNIINSNILGLACNESFSYCYSLDFRKR